MKKSNFSVLLVSAIICTAVPQALNDLGYDAGETDGVMGQKTKAECCDEKR